MISRRINMFTMLILLACFLTSANGGTTLIYHKFYDDSGSTFTDYSSFGNTGVSTVDGSSNPTVTLNANKGATLDGSSSYIILPPNSSSSGTVSIPDSFYLVGWFFLRSDGPLFYRKSGSNVLISLSVTSTNLVALTIVGDSSYSTLSVDTSDSNNGLFVSPSYYVERNKWIYLELEILRYNFFGDNMNIEIWNTGTKMLERSIYGEVYHDIASGSEMYIGYDGSNYLDADVFMFRLFDGGDFSENIAISTCSGNKCSSCSGSLVCSCSNGAFNTSCTCDTGYWDNGGTCESCSPSQCTACDSSGDCTACSNNAGNPVDCTCSSTQWDNAGTCTDCTPAECTSCDSSGDCTACSNNAGNTVDCTCASNQGVNGVNCVDCTPPLCTTCSSAGVCTACSNNAGNPVDCTCSSTQWDNAGTCTDCTPAECTSCDSSGNCTACSNNAGNLADCTCSSTQWDNAGTCTDCTPAQCTSCNSSGDCTACSNNAGNPVDCTCAAYQGFDGTNCVDCLSTSCTNCSSTGVCSACSNNAGNLNNCTCASNQGFDGTNCVDCAPALCTTCNSSGVCTACSNNAGNPADCSCAAYQGFDGTNCVDCTSTLCTSCDSSAVCSACSNNAGNPNDCTCASNQGFDGTNCIDCAPALCTTCNSSGVCTACSNNAGNPADCSCAAYQGFDGTNCVDCTSNLCTSCDSSAVCSVCSNNAGNPNDCTCAAYQGFDGTNCVDCTSTLCTSCDSSGVCSVCSNNAGNPNDCTCAAYQGFDGTNCVDCTSTLCTNCDSSAVCSACSNNAGNPNDCTCAGYQGFDGTNCVDCISTLCTTCSSAGVCSACSNNAGNANDCTCAAYQGFDGTNCVDCTSNLCTSCDSSAVCSVCSNNAGNPNDCTCAAYQGFDGSNCVDCLSTLCTSCDSGGVCSVCSNNAGNANDCTCAAYQGFDGTNCVDCISTLCTSCDSSAVCSVCSNNAGNPNDCTCAAYQGFDGTNCVDCISTLCTSCDSGGVCSVCSNNAGNPNDCTCASNQGFDGTNCIDCAPALCTTCNSLGVCTACSNNAGNPADCTCSSSQWDDGATCIECSTISVYCETCTSPGVCTSCTNNPADVADCSCGPDQYIPIDQCCHHSCSECFDSSENHCLTCRYANTALSSSNSCECIIENASVVNEECVCPVNSSEISGKCECEDSYYASCEDACDSSNFQCESCDSSCFQCSGGAPYDCLECFENGGIIDSGYCLYCDPGEYADPRGTCEKCSELCNTCFGFEQCFDCSSENLILDGATCRCPDKMYRIDLECFDCPSLCNDCTSPDICTSCGENGILLDGTCTCGEGYYQEGTKCTRRPFSAYLSVSYTNQLTITYQEPLSSPLNVTDISITLGSSVTFSWVLVSSSNNSTVMDLEFEDTIDEGTGVTIIILTSVTSEEGSFLLGNPLVGSLYQEFIHKAEEIQAIESATPAATKTTVGGGIGVSLFLGSPSAIWTLVNTIQILSYIPLSGISLPENLNSFLISLNDFSIIPNFFEMYISETGGEPYSEAKAYGFESTYILLNSGSMLSTLGLLILANIACYTISIMNIRHLSLYFMKVSKGFVFAAYIRFWVESYLELAIGSIINIIHLSEDTMFSSINGWLSMILMVIFTQLAIVLSPFIVMFFSYTNYNKISDDHDYEFHSKWGSLFYEFHNSTYISSMFYSLFMLRRLFFAISQIFLNSLIWLQVSFNGVVALIMLVYVIKKKPFKESSILFLNVVSEAGISIVFIILPAFLFEISEYTMGILGYTVMGLILTVMLVNMGTLFFLFFKALVAVYKTPSTKRKEKTTLTRAPVTVINRTTITTNRAQRVMSRINQLYRNDDASLGGVETKNSDIANYKN